MNYSKNNFLIYVREENPTTKTKYHIFIMFDSDKRLAEAHATSLSCR